MVGTATSSVTKVVSKEPLSVTEAVVATVAVDPGAVPLMTEVTKVNGTASLCTLVGTEAILLVGTTIGAWVDVTIVIVPKAVVKGVADVAVMVGRNCVVDCGEKKPSAFGLAPLAKFPLAKFPKPFIVGRFAKISLGGRMPSMWRGTSDSFDGRQITSSFHLE